MATLSKRISLVLLLAWLAACAPPSSPDCARADVLCVGLVTAYGKVDDHGLNQSAWEGVRQARDAGLIQHAAFIETIDARDRTKNIQFFLENDYDLVVTVGIGMDKATRLAADEWPERRFIGVDQPQADPLPNLAGLVFPEDRGGFLAGFLAASVSETGQPAALCEAEAIPSMWRTCEGFRAGVRHADPDMRARVLYNSDTRPSELFNDPAWGEKWALFVLDGGADLLFAAGGGTALAALEAAAGRGVAVIGMDEDLYYQIEHADFVLASIVKEAGAGVYALLQQAAQGQFISGEVWGGYALSPLYRLETRVPPALRERFESVRLGLFDGSIQTGVSREP